MTGPGPMRPILALALAIPTLALSAQNATDATTTTIQVPRLIRFNGVLNSSTAAPEMQSSVSPAASRTTELIFSLYAEETGGEPLWQETQSVELDATGHYSALLGSTQPEGLPVELFNSAQAQWLGVARQGEAEQRRIMLVSVPFALKAVDAETLGGKPPSAYALSVPITVQEGAPGRLSGGAEPSGLPNAHPLTITGGGTADYLPMWTSASALASSPIYENKTSHNLGIGTTSPTAAALEVVNNKEAPVLAQTSGKNLAAVQGTNLGSAGSGAGVYGASSTPDGAGVYGVSSGDDAAAVWGAATAKSGPADGVYGTSVSSNSYTAGVWGTASDSKGGGNGVVGESAGNNGGTGVWGVSSATTGYGDGVYGQSYTGTGVYGKTTASGQNGVVAVNRATSGNSNGLYVDTSSGGGVGAWIDNAAGGYIIVGAVDNSGTHMFDVDGSGDGKFAGDLDVVGNISKAGGSFKIDDPIDPANKYLYHSFVESPDMKNIYDGNVITDERGQATVALPAYFEALNRDFRYQLTVIGQFAQAIVEKEISGNRFTIRTSKPNVRVSWQVTGIRQDPWANAHRIPNEEQKPVGDRGYYLHPELYGAAPSRSIDARHATPSPKVLERDSSPPKLAASNAAKGSE
jgi:trimeric autotransporter adhesin